MQKESYYADATLRILSAAMRDSINCRFNSELEQRLRAAFSASVSALRTLRRELPQNENLLYIITLHQPIRGDMPALAATDHPTVRRLRADAAFQALFRLACEEPSIRQVLLDSSGGSTHDELKDPTFDGYIELSLLRICAYLEDNTTRLDDLMRFLSLDTVERTVRVPLLNVELPCDEIAIGGFGRLHRIRSDSVAQRSPYAVELTFPIRTGHFAAAVVSPVWQEIKKRVTLIRIVAHPLTAYNHFSVQFFLPWEELMLDWQFATRFWGRGPRQADVRVATFATISPTHAVDIELMAERSGAAWDKLTPWRLACDRLDDAVFKLQCGSPDSILDIVIGIESLLIEPESRQESTHKVSVRAARLLEGELRRRADLFRTIKEMYRNRSALAHGQAWRLDANGQAEVEKAAKILSRILNQMALAGQTKLDLRALDLA